MDYTDPQQRTARMTDESEGLEMDTVMVVALNYSYYDDPRPMQQRDPETGQPYHDEVIRFHTFTLPHPREKNRRNGEKAQLGVAEVPGHLYDQFYKDHPSFMEAMEYQEMWYDDDDDDEDVIEPVTSEEEVVVEEDVDPKATGASESDEGGGDATTEEATEASGNVSGTGALPEGAGTAEADRPKAEATQPVVPNPLAGVDFASDDASELAAQLGLDAEAMGKVRPSGTTGAYTAPDVRKANKKRVAAK